MDDFTAFRSLLGRHHQNFFKGLTHLGCRSNIPFQEIARFAHKKVPISFEIGTFWSCWADSNRRPHPYQVIKSIQPIDFQGFRAIFAQKDDVFGSLFSIAPIRSFPRVGHGVGQGVPASHETLCAGLTNILGCCNQ